MRGYKKKKRSHGEVELNMAAMLDMAFQLLAFFILTFNPSPVEAEISLRMPPPKAAPGQVSQLPPDLQPPIPDEEGQEVPISVYSTADGEISRIMVGGQPVPAQRTAEETMAGIGAASQRHIGDLLELHEKNMVASADIQRRKKLADDAFARRFEEVMRKHNSADYVQQ